MLSKNRPRPDNPYDRIVQIYEDYLYVNDKLLENYQPNADFSLEYLQTRGKEIAASIKAIKYVKEYVLSEEQGVPDPPW